MSTTAVDRPARTGALGLRLVAASLVLVALDFVTTIVACVVMETNFRVAVAILNGVLVVAIAAAVLAIVGEWLCEGLAREVGAVGLLVGAVVLAAIALAVSLFLTLVPGAVRWVIRNPGFHMASLGQHARTASYILFVLFLGRLAGSADDPRRAARARFIVYGLAFVIAFTVAAAFVFRKLLAWVPADPWPRVQRQLLIGDVLVSGFGMLLFAMAALLTDGVRRSLEGRRTPKPAEEAEVS
jgi:hypothetical protein